MSAKRKILSLVAAVITSTSAIASIVVLSAWNAERKVVAQSADCTTPPILPDTNGAHWPQSAHITVVFAPGQFTDDEMNAITRGIMSWQNTNGPGGNGSGVTFEFTVGTDPSGQINTQYIHRANTPDPGGGVTSIAFSGTQTTSGNLTLSARTAFD